MRWRTSSRTSGSISRIRRTMRRWGSTSSCSGSSRRTSRRTVRRRRTRTNIRTRANSTWKQEAYNEEKDE